jgi:hypothetical protein
MMRVGEGIKGGQDEIGVRYFQSKVCCLKGKGALPTPLTPQDLSARHSLMAASATFALTASRLFNPDKQP